MTGVTRYNVRRCNMTREISFRESLELANSKIAHTLFCEGRTPGYYIRQSILKIPSPLLQGLSIPYCGITIFSFAVPTCPLTSSASDRCPDSTSIDLHIYSGGIVTAVWYRDDIRSQYFRPFLTSMGIGTLLMDNNIRVHRADIAREYVEYETLLRTICLVDVNIVTNMESHFPAMLFLWLGREFYRGKYGMTGSSQAWTADHGGKLGDHFSDKSKIPENATFFSISLLEEEIRLNVRDDSM
ncbi:hypothetical protein AVEN_180238-1 [Araneus ventricosus]|uniref:Uncharacterized protein n=1 Tax=Araneus ventricosus TaxID=182803 RepID=A0A4Y2JTW4_ARAVE|nr:hypothetical protein AVEN_180238-1 [Araneus ventricosus]